MAAQKKAKAPEPVGESAPMWIVSFADLVTLLFSFFVVLYALEAEGPKGKKDELMAAIKIMNHVEPAADSTDPVDMLVLQAYGRPLPPRREKLGTAENPTNGAEGPHPEVTTIRPGKEIVTGGLIGFDAGKTDLNEDSLKTIKVLAEKVRGKNNVLMIKGHVAFDEISLRPDDPNGMNLSYRRATVVSDELAKLGIDRKVLRPVACGAFEPLKTGVYDPDSLRQNRRAEIYTTDYTASEYFPTTTVPAADRTEKPAPEEAKEPADLPPAPAPHH